MTRPLAVFKFRERGVRLYIRYADICDDLKGKAMVASQDVDDELFWNLAEPMIGAGQITEGELMRSRCVRVGKEFLAMPEYQTGDLVVKLPRERVDELIASGDGLAFAPAKKVFREWVQVPERNETLWKGLLDEGYEFVS